MSPRARALVGLALLLLTAGQLMGATLQPAACDEDCAPACGDCASCPPVASLDVPPGLMPCLSRLSSVAAISSSPSSSLQRAIEHVPLELRA
jgi:hypothetical protein